MARERDRPKMELGATMELRVGRGESSWRRRPPFIVGDNSNRCPPLSPRPMELPLHRRGTTAQACGTTAVDRGTTASTAETRPGKREHRQGAIDPQERYYRGPVRYFRKADTGQAW